MSPKFRGDRGTFESQCHLKSWSFPREMYSEVPIFLQ